MGYETEPFLTGNEIVDSLQGLQKISDGIDSAEAKIAHVRRTLQIIDASALIGKQLMISSCMVLGRESIRENNRILFDGGLLFIANLEKYSCLLDDSVPVDSLAMNFPAAEVIGIDPEDAPAFRRLTLQVPVLAIDSCVLAEAA